MNKTVANKANARFGGHYQPTIGDERWKHRVANQMNNILANTSPTSPHWPDIQSILGRVSGFEKIQFIANNKERPH